jgi:hypothetical protein
VPEQPKTVPISVGSQPDLWIYVNRFRVDVHNDSFQFYFTIQDKYEPKPKVVFSITISQFTFFEFFVNKKKGEFASSVDKQRENMDKHTALPRLSEDELKEGQIHNFIMNFGGLAISKEGGGEAWFGTYSPWQVSQISSIKSRQEPPGSIPSVARGNVLRCMMLNRTLIELWDELVQIANRNNSNNAS